MVRSILVTMQDGAEMRHTSTCFSGLPEKSYSFEVCVLCNKLQLWSHPCFMCTCSGLDFSQARAGPVHIQTPQDNTAVP